MSLRDTIRSARLPERTVEMCLRGDLVAAYEDLERQAFRALQADSFAGDDGDAGELQGKLEAIRAEMQTATVTFHLRSLGSLRPMTLQAEHPPREDEDGNPDPQDAAVGYNRSTYYPARIREACYQLVQGEETLAASELADEDWDGLLDALSDRQFNDLFGAVWSLDNEAVSVPTLHLASLLSQRTGETSKQHSAGESALDGSEGGSPSGSPSSSTTTPDDSFA